MSVIFQGTESGTIVVPDRVKGLPLFRGMHVGVMFHVEQDGTPDFKVLDAARRLNCLAMQLCGICGRQLSLAKSFFLGTKSVVHGVSFDPGMHHECAQYSRAVCPYLAGQHGHVPIELVKVPAGYAVLPDVLASAEKPETMNLVRTLTYDLVEHRGQVYAQCGPYISREEFALQHKVPHV